MASKKLSQHQQQITNAFAAAVTTYDSAAFIEQQISECLLERLEYFNIQPQRILDLGCGTGAFSKQISTKFPNAHIVAIDLTYAMANFAMQQHASSKLNFCCAAAEQLPFAAQQFDLIISNCSFMCSDNLTALYEEIARVIKPQGILLFSTLGPNTLQDLAMPTPWIDLITIGNLLQQVQLVDPIVDAQQLNISYDTLSALLQDLQQSGTFAIDNSVDFPELHLPFTANFEVIYGVAHGNPTPKQYKDSSGNVYVPLKSLEII